MANKAVTNPCSGSGSQVFEDWTQVIDPRTKSVKTICPMCNQLVSIGKGNRTLRIHNMSVISALNGIAGSNYPDNLSDSTV